MDSSAARQAKHRNARSFLTLPLDLQLACLAVSPDVTTLCAALSTCSELRKLGEQAFEAFCRQHWPQSVAVAVEAAAAGDDAGEPPPRPAHFWRNLVRTGLLIRWASAATTDPRVSFNDHWTAQRRTLLIEWLIQVSHAWHLDGSVVFTAVRLLDAFYAAAPPTSVKILQLVGICCLRVTMTINSKKKEKRAGALPDGSASVAAVAPSAASPQAESPPPLQPPTRAGCDPPGARPADLEPASMPPYIGCRLASSHHRKTKAHPATVAAVEPAAKHLADPATQGDGRVEPRDARAFAEICANTYTVEDVEQMTSIVAGFAASIPRIMAAPTARHFLRGLWAALHRPTPTCLDSGTAEVAPAAAAVTEEVHLAGFLLHLALLCPSCCAAPPSHSAAAALSLAREALGLAAWPAALRAAMPLRLTQDLAPLRASIASVQQQYDVPHLRSSWVHELPWAEHGARLAGPERNGEDGDGVAAAAAVNAMNAAGAVVVAAVNAVDAEGAVPAAAAAAVLPVDPCTGMLAQEVVMRLVSRQLLLQLRSVGKVQLAVGSRQLAGGYAG